MDLIEVGAPLVPEPNWKRLLSRKLEREAAAEHWRIVTGEMERRQILAETNRHAITRLVLAYIVHDRAAAKLMRSGPVNEPAKANVRAIPRPSPYLAVAREASAQCSQLESELGLSPRTRGKVAKVANTTAKVTGAMRYLRSIPKPPPPALPAAPPDPDAA